MDEIDPTKKKGCAIAAVCIAIAGLLFVGFMVALPYISEPCSPGSRSYCFN